MGWGGLLRHDEARCFAAELCRLLSRRGRLDESAPGPTSASSAPGTPTRAPAADSPLAPGAALRRPGGGGGALAAGVRKRVVGDQRRAVAKVFLDVRAQVPVAGPAATELVRDEGALTALAPRGMVHAARGAPPADPLRPRRLRAAPRAGRHSAEAPPSAVLRSGASAGVRPRARRVGVAASSSPAGSLRAALAGARPRRRIPAARAAAVAQGTPGSRKC